MKKSILNLRGAQELSKSQMKNIQGMVGEGSSCNTGSDCYSKPAKLRNADGPSLACINGVCTLTFANN